MGLSKLDLDNRDLDNSDLDRLGLDKLDLALLQLQTHELNLQTLEFNPLKMLDLNMAINFLLGVLNLNLSSQIGYVICLADASDKANIIHWSSIKCKRVTRSVLASELYAMAHGFDTGAVIKSTVEKILRIPLLPMIMCTDSKSLYDCLVKVGSTQEKRLMVDLMCLG